MGIAERLTGYMAKRDWRPAEIERDDHRLELHPLHAMLGAGFTLWRRQAGDGGWDLITSGHTVGDELVTAEGNPLELSEDVAHTIDGLLSKASD